MPSLFRFIFVVAAVGGLAYGGLYILATQFEPKQEMTTKQLGPIKIRKDQAP